MKILVGQHNLNTIGGSETYTYELVRGLVELGHTVEVITWDGVGLDSPIPEKMVTNLGVVVNNLSGKYDACFISHNSMIDKLLGTKLDYNKDNLFQIVHGIVPGLETPTTRSDVRFISISDEIKNHINVESTTILNMVDTNRFKPTATNNELRNVLSISRNENFNSILGSLCDRLGLSLLCGNNGRTIVNIEDVIDRADLVVTLGRGCFESMASGKNVFVADSRPYQGPLADGLLTKDNFDSFIKNNCSGRYNHIRIVGKFIVDEFEKYNPKHGDDLRKIAESQFDVITQCKKILKLVRGYSQ